MSGISLNETELKGRILEIYQEEYYKVIEEKWSQLNNDDKTIVIELVKYLYPETAKLINESKWYNTVGDLVGIVDPTGIVDIVNGVSYWRQGDKLFGLLSFISAVPIIGDIIGKGVKSVIKGGGPATKAFKTAVVAGDAAKIASTAKKAGGPIAKMVESSPKWGGKLMEIFRNVVGKIPFVGRGFVRAVEEFISLFTKASVTKNAFRSHKGVKNSWLKYMKSDAKLGQKLYAGVPRIFGGNPATRSLMRRTKTYLGFLDFLGLGNFVGPEELSAEQQAKWDEYSKTKEAQQTWEAEKNTVQSTTPPPPPPSNSGFDLTKNTVADNTKTDGFSSLVGSLLGKALV